MEMTVRQNVNQTVGDTIDNIKWLTMKCDRILLLSFGEIFGQSSAGALFSTLSFSPAVRIKLYLNFILVFRYKYNFISGQIQLDDNLNSIINAFCSLTVSKHRSGENIFV